AGPGADGAGVSPGALVPKEGGGDPDVDVPADALGELEIADRVEDLLLAPIARVVAAGAIGGLLAGGRAAGLDAVGRPARVDLRGRPDRGAVEVHAGGGREDAADELAVDARAHPRRQRGLEALHGRLDHLDALPPGFREELVDRAAAVGGQER